MKVVLIVDIQNIGDTLVFDRHLDYEGLSKIENEKMTYIGEAHTHILGTRAYILNVVSEGLCKTTFNNCKIIFQIGDNTPEAYKYDKVKKDFLAIKV